MTGTRQHPSKTGGKKPEPIVFRDVPVSQRTIVALGQHALELPQGHPVRAIARLYLERYQDAPPTRFVRTPEDASAFDGLDELMQEAA